MKLGRPLQMPVLVMGAALFVACTSHTAAPQHEDDERRETFCSLQPVVSANYAGRCHGCFDVDLQGRGFCRAVLDELDTTEMAAVIRWSVSSRDKERAWGERCSRELWPLARFTAEYGRRQGFEDPSHFKQVVAQPEKFGGDELAGLEVRYNGGHNGKTGQHWGGVREVANVRPGPIRPTCCLGPGCTGTDYRCTAAAAGVLPLHCEPLDDVPLAD